ncbi:hypothetical protein ACHAXR_002538, partial [Thalassiosira sp. AJA248-18]
MPDPRSTEQTPLMPTDAERGLAGIRAASPPPTSSTSNTGHLQSFGANRSKLRSSPIKELHKTGVGLRQRGKSIDSGDVVSKKSKTRQRKNVGKFRRKKQDKLYLYATWKGRIGVHVEYDEFDLKKLVDVIYQTLPTDWELVDCYDVIRAGEEHAPDGGGEYAEGDGQIHASMPEVFVFGFGAVVFWNFKGEEQEKQWIEQHLFPHKEEVLGLKHNRESIQSACDELGFCYGEVFKWHRDVVELQTRDAGEKLACSYAIAKSSNLSIYEWRMEQAIQRNAHIPEDLAKHGQLHLNRREINVEIGRLYLLNNAINLETNMLDTPEEFWEDDRFHTEYDKSIKYLDVEKRINLLNSR